MDRLRDPDDHDQLDHHDHNRQEHAINVVIELNNDPANLVIDDCRGDVYFLIEHAGLDHPDNEPAILNVLRALHDRRPDLYHSVSGGIAWTLLDALDAKRRPAPGDGQQ